MSNLIEVKKGNLYCSSKMFADKFLVSHNEVLKKIRKLTGEYSPVKSEFLESEFTNSRNQTYEMFLMTEKGFMFLVMNTNAKGKESKKRVWDTQNVFINAFNNMRELLLKQQVNKNNIEWKKNREMGKSIRKELSDTLKEFVEYATNQGSKNAKMYYANITKMEYKALGFIQESKPKIRETLDTMELYQLIMAEDLCRKRIKKYMDDGLHYKEIYLLTKIDIENFLKHCF